MARRNSERVEGIEAREFERALPAAQRKRLGQFFTGLPLGTLLASLIGDRPTTVMDPMAGHGDLLKSTVLAMPLAKSAALQLDGIEIDQATAEFARRRLASETLGGKLLSGRIATGSAFDPEIVGGFEQEGYDLVITNPPYVRYQSQGTGSPTPADVRGGLRKIAQDRGSDPTASTWRRLIDGYSGLADLSIPSCILAGMLCKPGGRLALVMPATWRSRDYADVLRYLLIRLFDIEFVVADKQPGWFSDALVRTHLIVARRHAMDQTERPVGSRATWPTARWIEVSPDAATETSLVGKAFPGPGSELAFAKWLRGGRNIVPGVEVRTFDIQAEWQAVRQKLSRKTWFQPLEGGDVSLPLSANQSDGAAIPEAVRRVLPDKSMSPLVALDRSGILVGQGLRTGCNRFFYVDRIGSLSGKTIQVRASDTFTRTEFEVPKECLRLAVQKQADLADLEDGRVPSAMVLDLAGWVLPEDFESAQAQGGRQGHPRRALPKVMPASLSDYVRRAADTIPDTTKPDQRIPDLSAVRTNVRGARQMEGPRFWYMLPPLAPRHRPSIFVPRVNHGSPRPVANPDRTFTIDANFSTIWPNDSGWGDLALYALFSSAWVRASMEALGVPMGGGAVKLEATHLRQIPLPHLNARCRSDLQELGASLLQGSFEAQLGVDALILGQVFPGTSFEESGDLAERLSGQQLRSREARRRIAS